MISDAGDRLPLSPAGRARRQAMRAELAAFAVRRARTRAAARAVSLFAAAAALLWLCVPRVAAPAPPAAGIAIVRDDPTILQRCAVTAAVDRSVYIADAELRRLLQVAGRDGDLVRAGHRVLLPGFVPDDWLADRVP